MNGQFNGKAHGEGISLSFIAWWNCVTFHWSNTTTVLVFMASPHDLGVSAQPQSGSEFQFNSRTFSHLGKKKRGAEKGWNIILYFLRNDAFGNLSCVSVRLWNKWRFWSTSQTVKFKQSRTKSVSTSFFPPRACDLLCLSMPSSKGSPILSGKSKAG